MEIDRPEVLAVVVSAAHEIAREAGSSGRCGTSRGTSNAGATADDVTGRALRYIESNLFSRMSTNVEKRRLLNIAENLA